MNEPYYIVCYETAHKESRMLQIRFLHDAEADVSAPRFN